VTKNVHNGNVLGREFDGIFL